MAQHKTLEISYPFSMIKILIIMLSFSVSFASDNFSGKDSMNDIKFSEYKEFPEKWTLVTIRFRKDTSEMRLTYANELALKTLKEGSINYPDGAVIGKTGFHTGVDPQFVSSVVPLGIRRYQLMVKDKKKYAATGGWGYALFDANGVTFPENPIVTQNACYACHTIVENRGDVFSQPFSFTQKTKFLTPNSPRPETQIQFAWITVNKLPKRIVAFLPEGVKKIRFVKNTKLRMNLFQGTLDEMKPILEHEVVKQKTPALFLSSDEKRFVLVYMKKSQECMELGSFEIVSTDVNNNHVVEKYCAHD